MNNQNIGINKIIILHEVISVTIDTILKEGESYEKGTLALYYWMDTLMIIYILSDY